MGRNVSIRDVASAAGVSVTTVSHVLNNTTGARVSEATRERVTAAAARLGYAPNKLAQGLRLQRTQILALLSDHIATTPHAGRIILGAQETASAQGWVVLLLNSGGDPDLEDREISALLQHQVDGVLYATMYHRKVSVPDRLSGLPVVLLDASSADARHPSVVPDEVGGGRAAVQALVTAGHRRIGFATNVDDIPATHGRMVGYQQALTEAGIPFTPEFVVVEQSDAQGGYRAALQLLHMPNRPTALFCFNDRMAMGAYRAAHQLGLRIPEDLSVVGFDNQELIADGLFPGLTTVALPHYEMGGWAVNTMIGLLDEAHPASHRRRRPTQITMECNLIQRDSVAAPATA
ncbi:LacI family DNA-binding transcriptional regulator [Actinoplanes sp. DH11]|uniref:LacI family DNA-binding transcriptional regulator n=1 Tax=Actinoplanes sp. DH11 TaxID=2857011 RepID=UPI001E37C749|nr:LacI family DNA-binding transcriptional regulator [Actinoplanes sp. DH11]